MSIKAIYLPDLAFDSSERSFAFIYKPNKRTFEMESDNEISYSEDSVLLDTESWLLFKTKLMVDEDNMNYGECKQITVDEFKTLREDNM